MCKQIWAPTLSDGGQLALLLGAELQHGVDDGQQGLPLAARAQEDELQQHVLQVLQVGHRLLPLLVPLQPPHLALQQLWGAEQGRGGGLVGEGAGRNGT